jgi:hypothetical protein
VILQGTNLSQIPVTGKTAPEVERQEYGTGTLELEQGSRNPSISGVLIILHPSLFPFSPIPSIPIILVKIVLR